MHICIVGTGAAGWIACNFFKHCGYVDKITIIGSSKIPPIGVGESNTLELTYLLNFLEQNGDFTLEEFIRETDAAAKYGVMYSGWSDLPFLHYFKNFKEFSESGDLYSYSYYGRLLANKDPNTHIHEIMGKDIFNEVNKNNMLLSNNEYKFSYHFDAGMFINFMSKIAIKNDKVTFIDAEVVGGSKIADKIEYISTKDQNISADFYIFGTGDANINEKFLNIEYEYFSDILLTNKAIFYPLEYTNKKNEFHPYTNAKTMKNGWRWITPTWSRIGTGYVFSDNHISVDQASHEFIEDIGKEIDPRIVDFTPKRNKKELHDNWCTVGMASGFIEPLDAPGLSLTINSVMHHIGTYIKNILVPDNKKHKEIELEKTNDVLYKNFLFWVSFILTQYKTCHRDDSEFWKDQKSVVWDYQENTIKNLDEFNPFLEKMMLHHTIAAKNISWKTDITMKPYVSNSFDYTTQHHFDFIAKYH